MIIVPPCIDGDVYVATLYILSLYLFFCVIIVPPCIDGDLGVATRYILLPYLFLCVIMVPPCTDGDVDADTAAGGGRRLQRWKMKVSYLPTYRVALKLHPIQRIVLVGALCIFI